MRAPRNIFHFSSIITKTRKPFLWKTLLNAVSSVMALCCMRAVVVCPQVENIPLLSAIADYQSYFAQGDSNTAKAKRYDLAHFLGFMTARERRTAFVAEVTAEDIRDFVTHRLDTEAPATVDRRLKTVKHLFKFYSEKFPGFYPPTKHVSGPILERGAPKSFSASELQSLDDAINERFDDEFRRLRARVIVDLGRFQGLRLEEIRTVTLGQFRPQEMELVSVRRKGNRFQTFPLDERGIEVIQNYLPAREQELREHYRLYRGLENKERFPLLISTRGADPHKPESYRMSEKTVYRTIRDIGEEAEIKAHPHKLRHTFVQEFLEASDKDLALTADAAGHTDVNTTRIYLRRGLDKIREVQSRRRA